MAHSSSGRQQVLAEPQPDLAGELAGGLPQPDLASELVGLLRQLPLLPLGAGLGKALPRSGPRSVARVAGSFGAILALAVAAGGG